MLLKRLIVAGLLAAASPLMWACSGDDGDDTAGGDGADPTDDAEPEVNADDGAAAGSAAEDSEPEATEFRVRIENVSAAQYMGAGVLNTPSGADEPGPLMPGASYEASFHAAPGAQLSFATMFVHSNDLFYAPAAGGIALFDDDGTPIDGDVTDQVMLWDAGSEVNQEPGTGADQALRQSGLDTGADDDDDSVRLARDDFDHLPATEDVLRVTVSGAAGNLFTLTIEIVSSETTLMAGGETLAVPLAPGVFVVHPEGMAPLFTEGEADRGDGLAALAEDGDPSGLAEVISEGVGLASPLAPGVWAVHAADMQAFFEDGQPDRGDGLEMLAEDGSPGDLLMAMAALDVAVVVFDTPDGADDPGPALPGGAYEFEVTAMPGDVLSFATMLVQSNDLFFAPEAGGIAFFDGETPVSGDVTSQVFLWDAGTELNQYPGAGPDQAPRQSSPDTGEAEDGPVVMVDDDFEYPAVDRLVRVEITPL
ncbi:MAG: spondin domain-containing protein [Myxococcales bacterium]|nr:spondin domain-containing protein [Myxococcales bacterium]